MKHLLLSFALLASFPAHATNAPFLAWYARDSQGKILPGSKLFFYDAGGFVARNVYSDETCAVSLGSSLTADGAGRFRRFYMGALNDCSSPALYKIIHKTAGGSTLWTEDNVAGTKTNLSGIVSATSAGATAAITGTNTSNGYGVKAVTSGGSSHAVWAEADTSTPVKSAVHIVPQDTTPSSPTKGDLWVDATTGKPRAYDGTAAGEIPLAGGGNVTAITAGANGLEATGNGTGNGFSGTGGTTSGAGVYGTGGAPNGKGGTFYGTGTASGIYARGGVTTGTGATIEGGNNNGVGLDVAAPSAGNAINATTNTGIGLNLSTGGTYGVLSVGGSTAGISSAAAGNGIGMVGAGAGTGNGVNGVSGGGAGSVGVKGFASGTAVHGVSTGGYGVVAEGDTTSPNYAAFRIVAQDTAPTTPAEGDIYYNITTHHLFVRVAAGWTQLDN